MDLTSDSVAKIVAVTTINSLLILQSKKKELAIRIYTDVKRCIDTEGALPKWLEQYDKLTE